MHIALCATERPQTRVYATDLFSQALHSSYRIALDLRECVKARECDLLKAYPQSLQSLPRCWYLIPPYIPHACLAGGACRGQRLSLSLLDGEEDGLDVYRRCSGCSICFTWWSCSALDYENIWTGGAPCRAVAVSVSQEDMTHRPRILVARLASSTWPSGEKSVQRNTV